MCVSNLRKKVSTYIQSKRLSDRRLIPFTYIYYIYIVHARAVLNFRSGKALSAHNNQSGAIIYIYQVSQAREKGTNSSSYQQRRRRRRLCDDITRFFPGTAFYILRVFRRVFMIHSRDYSITWRRTSLCVIIAKIFFQ